MTDIASQRDIARRLEQTQVIERPFTGYGTANPATPITGLPFFRTDLGWWIYYDGTRFLTAHEYSAPITDQISNTVAFDTAMIVTRDDGYHTYWTYAAVQTFISPTNNGANFWTIELQGVNNAIAATTSIASFDTSSYAAGGTYTSLGISTPEPANHPFVRAHVTKTGAPSALALTMTAYYRLVVI